MKKIIITIDGHSACGKSTLARQLAEKLKYGYIDTGAMYRAVTYYFLENRVNVQKTRDVDIALEKIDIHFKSTVGGNRTFLNGVDVEDAIRKMFVSKSVSHVAAMSKVRKKVVKQQQEMGKQKGIVMEGRDIGTVVFPKAELKIFLTANEDVRTKRRFDELTAKGQKVSVNGIKKNLKERDHLDSTREDSPLKQAEKAILIDNSNLTEKEQLAMVLALAEYRIAAINKIVRKTPPNNTRTEANQRPSNNKPTNRRQSETKPVQPKRKPAERTTRPTQPKTTPQKATSRTTTSRNQPKAKPVQTKRKSAERTARPTQQKTTPQKATSRTTTNRSESKVKPVQTKRKPVERKARPTQQKTTPPKRTNTQPKANDKTTISQPKAKPVQAKRKPIERKARPTQQKPAKKAKPQSANKKSNNTPTKKTSTKAPPRKKQNTPKPKRVVKKKSDLELDDFTF